MNRFIKAAFDRVAAALGLCITSPVLLLAMTALLLERDGPVLFTQLRPGLHGRPFRIYKLRTLRPPTAGDGRVRAYAERLTPFGKFLRRTSIDELPQLWNVLRGELSLVGPRPLLLEYLPRYSPTQARRHLVLPGITGLAQVNGRNSISWEEKLAWDVWYVDHWSLGLDARILARTVRVVFGGSGVRDPGTPGTEPFLGTRPSLFPTQEASS